MRSPARDEAFRVWIRQQGCVVCCWTPSECAHAPRSRGAGGGDWHNMIPLCRHHHRQQHNMGRDSFAEKYALDLADLASNFTKRYWAEVDAGRLDRCPTGDCDYEGGVVWPCDACLRGDDE